MVRLARIEEIERIMDLCDIARRTMRANGNISQWTGGYPTMETIRHDIENGHGFMVERNGETVAYFAFMPSPEPTYEYIEGSWLDTDSPYYVIHRLASTPESHGVFQEVSDYALSVCPNIKVDTHEDNAIMRKVIAKAGYIYCGVIYLEDGDPRLAYQLKR